MLFKKWHSGSRSILNGLLCPTKMCWFCIILLYFVMCGYLLDACCFLMRDREEVDLDGGAYGEVLEEVERGEIVISMRKGIG